MNKSTSNMDDAIRVKLFAVEYIRNGQNAQAAAREAGYSEGYAKGEAYKLVHHPVVKKYIKDANDLMEQRLTATIEWKIKKLVQVVNTSIPDNLEELVKTSKSIKQLKKNLAFVDPKSAVTAIAELNRMQGHHAPTRTLNANLNAEAQIEEDKECLQKLIEQYRRPF